MALARGLAALLATSLLAACAGPAVLGSAGSDTVDSSFRRWTQNVTTGGLLMYAARAREQDGVTVICGSFGRTPEVTTSYSAEMETSVRDRTRLSLAGSTVLRDLRGFAGMWTAETVIGRPAGCVKTALPWQDAYADPGALDIHPPRRSYTF
ncbi:MAG: hypothetical protein AAF192_07895 [Pseudomonadota bacterium]